MRLLVGAEGIDVNVVGNGCTPLYLAAQASYNLLKHITGQSIPIPHHYQIRTFGSRMVTLIADKDLLS